MRVPLFDMQRELAPVRASVEAAIARVLDSGEFIGGPEVRHFETELAQACGVQHAVGVSSGTDALLLIAMALGLDPNATVVTTPFSYIATASTIARTGARLVFADIDEDSLNLAPARALAACSDNTRAIVTVNLYGQPAALPSVPPAQTTAPTAQLSIIEDSAQSLGAGPVRGRAAATSFFPTKNLGALGDAGAVLTDDTVFATRVTQLRGHGAAPKYHYPLLGGNFRIDALQAAILAAKLPHLASWTAARRRNATRYRAMFASSTVPPELRLPSAHPDHVYHQFVVRTPRRDALRDYLTARGIGTEIYYPEPLHLQPCFVDLGYRPGSMPIAERACTEVLALPIAPTLTEDEQAFVVATVAAFFAS
ncbi:MAG: DegT/DnrJ/EryC1/StrS family aminotransferase [Kofleriaceae bacterium]|nr:DegT/DnrJ/EryC1/StrS family aminotransferase [Kofleriaceae bacterium]